MKEIENFTLKVKSFRKMEAPFNWGSSKNITRYVMYADISSLSYSLKNWFKTNPRHQNINQSVSKSIKNSLFQEHENFHNLNKGILFSAKDVIYDNLKEEVNFTFEDKNIHGNIDGGHTLKVIHEYTKQANILEETYVFIEIIRGVERIQEIVALAGARNRTVQVDLQSLANLEKKFDSIKTLLEKQNIPFRNRIIYKANEDKMDLEEIEKNNSEKKDIKIRDFIAILNMFNPDLYPTENNSHPMASYSSKEKALKKFLDLDDNEELKNSKKISKSIEDSIFRMRKIIRSIFELYDLIELEFPDAYNSNNRKYGKKLYAKIRKGRLTKFMHKDLSETPTVPDGLIYPLLGAFRALVYYNKNSNAFEWCFDPIEVWKEHKKFLTRVIANFLEDNKEIDKPDPLGKNKNLWETLFDKIQLYKLERQQREPNHKSIFISA